MFWWAVVKTKYKYLKPWLTIDYLMADNAPLQRLKSVFCAKKQLGENYWTAPIKIFCLCSERWCLLFSGPNNFLQSFHRFYFYYISEACDKVSSISLFFFQIYTCQRFQFRQLRTFKRTFESVSSPFSAARWVSIYFTSPQVSLRWRGEQCIEPVREQCVTNRWLGMRDDKDPFYVHDGELPSNTRSMSTET